MVGGEAQPRPIYRHDLDGLRAVAVILVVLDHAQVPFPLGSAGVGAFFVLSGYVITNVLLSGGPLRHFYARRALRLFPALGLLVAFVVVAGVAGLWTGPWVPGVVATALYVTNWAAITASMGPLGHAWSLAIEEQFYLVWPLALLVLGRRAWAVAVVGIGIAFVARAGAEGMTIYFSTLTRMDALFVGCLLALIPGRLPRALAPVGLTAIVLAGMLGGVLASSVVMPMATLGAALVIRAPWPPLARLAPLGRRAYGIYLWSWPLTILVGPLAVPLTFVCAELSYRLVEHPILARKDALGRRPAVYANRIREAAPRAAAGARTGARQRLRQYRRVMTRDPGRRGPGSMPRARWQGLHTADPPTPEAVPPLLMPARTSVVAAEPAARSSGSNRSSGARSG